MELSDEEFLAGVRRGRATGWMLPLFFVSGATGLVYQTVWARQLHVIFGTSTFAIATVLAAFMLGLAIGGFWMARSVDTIPSPLRWYGWLEVMIGVYALLFPIILSGLKPVYLNVWWLAQPSPWVFSMIQFLLVGAALLLPTACMGATLPLLARFATGRLGAAGDRVGTLYSVNTAGAVLGTWMCGFVLLPALGVQWNTWACAIANLVLGAGALVLDRWVEGDERRASNSVKVEQRVMDPQLLLMCAVAAGMGFSALLYEVAWTRVLALMLGASVYAFSMMLIAFLVGIAGGGFLGGRFADALYVKNGLPGVLFALAGLEVGVAVIAYGMHFFFPELPFLYVFLYDFFGGGESPWVQWWASAFIAMLVMTPVALLMGMAFPLTVRAVTAEEHELGSGVGWIYGANTLGGAFGAATAGFLFLPWLQMTGTIMLGVALNLLVAAVIGIGIWRNGGGRRPLVSGVAVLALGALGIAFVYSEKDTEAVQRRQLLMTAGMYKYVSQFDRHTREGVMTYAVAQYELLYYREGVSSVVTVAKNRESGNLWLANNGKVEASTTVDMPTQVLVALLPFQYVSDPSQVLVIGMASGITAGAASVVPDVDRLDVVELEPAILEAARYFDNENHNILDNPKTNIVLNDGRNHLLLTEPNSYNVIISEPSNPWISGVSNLFTKEFWEMGKARLTAGGVWAQWVQMYGMDDTDLRTLLATFCDVFEYAGLYMTVADADLVLLGSDEPLPVNLASADNFFKRWPALQKEFANVEMGSPVSLLAAWQMDENTIREMTKDAWLNTDDNMSIEYRAPLNLHKRNTAAENVEMLVHNAHLPKDQEMKPADWLDLSSQYLSRNDWDRAMLAAIQALRILGNHLDEVSRNLDLALREQNNDQWIASVGSILRAAGFLLNEPNPPEWLAQRWERWRIATLKYLEGDEQEKGESEDGVVEPVRSDQGE